jgi:hypothetical protein
MVIFVIKFNYRIPKSSPKRVLKILYIYISTHAISTQIAMHIFQIIQNTFFFLGSYFQILRYKNFGKKILAKLVDFITLEKQKNSQKK